MCLQRINSQYFGPIPSAVPKDRWVSSDGKDMRGTMDGVLGEKRGLNIVRPFVQQDRVGLSGPFHHGSRESGIACVRELLEGSPLKAAPVIFDASHTQYQTLTIVEEASGAYIARVKEDQKGLLEDLKGHLPISRPFGEMDTLDKAHGGPEHRQGRFYHISGIAFDGRWGPCCPSTLMVVDRQSTQLRTGRVATERSFYVPNRPVQGIGGQTLL